VGVGTFLSARILGVDSLNRRISFLWRQLSGADRAILETPTAPETRAKFPREGVYSFEASATVGAVTMRDTLFMLVRLAPAPARPKVVQPRAGDSVIAGKPVLIAWEMPVGGMATVQFSRTLGNQWDTLASNLASVQGLSRFEWHPLDSLKGSRECLVRVTLQSGDSLLVAEMPGPFFLISRSDSLFFR
jgi:hypothetical protein